jgi:hypothetical protein
VTESSGRQRIAVDGRALKPEEIAKPSAYRPEDTGRGLHAIHEPRHRPWRHGQAIPLSGPLEKVAVHLLWFRLDDAPLEASRLWDQSPTLVAPALAIALRGLAGGEHLVVTGTDSRDNFSVYADLPTDELVPFLRAAFDWDFRAYVGPTPDAKRAGHSGTVRTFVRDRSADLKRWTIVADEYYDMGGLEIWSREFTVDEIAERLDLDAINAALAKADPDRQ